MPTKATPHRPAHYRPREQRPSAAKRGYDRRWRTYRQWFLRRNPLCAECDRPAAHVDHIIAVDGPNDPGFWPPSNHQALCHSCHSRKTYREDGGLGHVANDSLFGGTDTPPPITLSTTGGNDTLPPNGGPSITLYTTGGNDTLPGVGGR